MAFNWGSSNNNNNNSGFDWGNNNNNNNNNSGSLWGNNSNSIDNPNKDVIVENPPSDAITQVKFSPLQDLFVVTSWSNEVIAYKYDNSGNCGKLGIKKHDKGVLCCAWDNTGQNIFSGGCDNKINIWHSQNGSFKCLGNHNAPIKCIEFSKDHNILMSGSWDRTLKYWNINSGQQAGEIKLNEKVFCMSFLSPILTIGLSNKHVVAYDLRNPSKCVFDKQTVLKYQLRCLDIFPDKKGFAVSSVEGRTAIVHYSGNDDKKNFSFKCHRHPRNDNSYSSKDHQDVFGVNSLKFHKRFGTFLTSGDDGQINIWDKEGRSRLKHFERMKLPVVACDFNRNGNILLYGTSYNWNKGIEKYNPKTQIPQLYLHSLKQSEVDSKWKRN